MQQATARKLKDVNLECKHFFSGAAVYANGRICISLTPVGFAIKLPETSRDLLLKENGTKRLRYFPKGPIKKDYVVLPKVMLNDMKVLHSWVKLTIELLLRCQNLQRRDEVVVVPHNKRSSTECSSSIVFLRVR